MLCPLRCQWALRERRNGSILAATAQDGVESSWRDGGGGTCETTPISGAAHCGGRGTRADRDRLREQEEQQQEHQHIGWRRRQRDGAAGLVLPEHLPGQLEA